MGLTLVALLPWVLCSVFAALAADSRGNKMLPWFFLGLVLGPFAIGFAMIAPQRGPRSFERWCPFCYGLVHKDAVICMYCKNEIHSIETIHT